MYELFLLTIVIDASMYDDSVKFIFNIKNFMAPK